MELGLPTEVWWHTLEYVLRLPADVCSVAVVCTLFNKIAEEQLKRVCCDYVRDRGLRLATPDAPIVDSLRGWAVYKKRETAFAELARREPTSNAELSEIMHRRNTIKLRDTRNVLCDWPSIIARVWEAVRKERDLPGVVQITSAAVAAELLDHAIATISTVNERPIRRVAVLDIVDDRKSTTRYIFNGRHYGFAYFVMPTLKLGPALKSNVDIEMRYRPSRVELSDLISDDVLSRAIVEAFAYQKVAIFVDVRKSLFFFVYLGDVSSGTANVYSL
ncbi:hypothetical protein QKT49_gp016 [Acanthamoeba castellanii medusavirus]|uniref:F-box domain-containing protein n=1 Tax=Acanthamoeba castellanii medusavirus J1 TaxID=3114988 RepID=A0A3T1CWE9_9VIRU|nr:hypothetical protein QKT49_gp016 [Acanthamoeba castellanii medusavirus]BBI30156.1 hypothetical protein [Acanthamoeba castellanii medusavirus J1]